MGLRFRVQGLGGPSHGAQSRYEFNQYFKRGVVLQTASIEESMKGWRDRIHAPDIQAFAIQDFGVQTGVHGFRGGEGMVFVRNLRKFSRCGFQASWIPGG